MKMEVIGSSEMFVPVHQIVQCLISEDCNLYTHQYQNFRSDPLAYLYTALSCSCVGTKECQCVYIGDCE